MEIILKRIAKQRTYTIGRLYILKDEELERKVIQSYIPNSMRKFERVIPPEMLDRKHYFCDTLEPTWRNLLGIELLPHEENVYLGRVSGKKARKERGKTAIPEARDRGESIWITII